jgi:hypothetical protein
MSIAHTLIQPGEELNFEYAIFYSLTISALVTSICVSLIFSGGLRLISLIKNSEAAGLQLLGLEQEAIIKIRLITIGISVTFLVISFGFLEAFPGMFGTLHGVEYQSLIKDIEENKYSLIYFLMPSFALVLNVATRFYSDKINQQMLEVNLVFVIFEHPNHKPVPPEDSFLFSLTFVLSIPTIILFSFFTSFSSRHIRLIFFCPFQITMLSLALPIAFILKNNKMKNIIVIRCFDPIVHHIGSVLKIKKYSPTVEPLV